MTSSYLFSYRALTYYYFRRPLYLVIHNMDGMNLRNIASQQCFAALLIAGKGAIRLVASIDHVNAVSGLWDQRTMSNLRVLWQETTTYAPYVTEIEHGFEAEQYNSKKASNRNSAEGLQGMGTILKSLAPRHAELLKILAVAQLNDGDNKKGMERKAFTKAASNKLLVQSDGQLKNFLTELEEHDLVRTKKNALGEECIYIPHNVEFIKSIVDWTPA